MINAITVDEVDKIFDECIVMAERVREIWDCELVGRGTIKWAGCDGSDFENGRILPPEVEMSGLSIISIGDMPGLECMETMGKLMVLRVEIARRIAAAKLPPLVRQVMTLRYVQCLRWRAIADIMSRSIRWVYTQRDKGLEVMRADV